MCDRLFYPRLLQSLGVERISNQSVLSVLEAENRLTLREWSMYAEFRVEESLLLGEWIRQAV